MSIPFRRESLTARFLSPDGTEEMERQVEVRFDPLLGTSSRIAEGVHLPQADPAALAPIQAPDPACPFCSPRIEQVTPRVALEILPEGRLAVGETTLFPNLVPYAQYAAVAVLSSRHWLSLADFTPHLLADNLSAALAYIRAVYRHDPKAGCCAYNINYLYPSGGSLPHPHAQVYLDPYPTTMMRLQQEAAERYREEHGRVYWDDLVAAEEQQGERFVGRIGGTCWLTAFAPLGFNEVRAVLANRESILDLTDDDIAALARGLEHVLTWYDASGYNSFNLALYSGPLDGNRAFRVNLSLVTRSALLPYYRSDAMYLERLHWEAAVDRRPEVLAAELRGYFT
jgi:galactose-1-phosphate uridylyltransferase